MGKKARLKQFFNSSEFEKIVKETAQHLAETGGGTFTPEHILWTRELLVNSFTSGRMHFDKNGQVRLNFDIPQQLPNWEFPCE